MAAESPSPKIPVIAVVAAALAIAGFLVIGFKADLGLTTMTLIGFLAVTIVLAVATFILDRRLRQQEQETRQLRLVAERLQTILSAAPGGYCLFTPQGILRETARVPIILGIEKVTHFEDLVASIKEATDFVASFRKLQQSGAPFTLQIETTQDSRPVFVTGRRVRIGREGPLVDALWFNTPALAAPAEEKPSMEVAAGRTGRDVRAILDTLPFPVWRRRGDLRLIFCNQAYAKAVDATTGAVIAGQHELASPTARSGSGRTLSETAIGTGQAQNERRHVIIAGKRRLMEITEIPFKDGDKILRSSGYRHRRNCGGGQGSRIAAASWRTERSAGTSGQRDRHLRP